VFVVFFATRKLYSLHMYADLANNVEILWRWTNGLGLTSPMFEAERMGYHYFAGHFSPIAYIAALPFSLWSKPETLIVTLVVALFSGSIPIVLYAKERISPTTGYFWGVIYLLYPTIQFTGLYDSGYLQFCIPAIAWAFYCLYKRHLAGYWAFIIVALICREEVGLTIGLFGLYIALAKKDWRTGFGTAICGWLYFFIVLAYIIPSFKTKTDGVMLQVRNFQQFGATPKDVITFLILHPLTILRYLVAPVRLGNFVLFVLPLLGLSLGSPLILVCAFNILTSFLANSISIYSYMLYYLSPSIPFLFFAAIETARKLEGTGQIAGISETVCVGALACSIMFGPSPISCSFWMKEYKLGVFHSTNFHRSHYSITQHAIEGRRVAAMVPKDAVVSAEQPYLPFLYDRKKAYIFPFLPPEVDYVLIDRRHPLKSGYLDTYLDFRQRPEHYYQMLEAHPGRWRLIFEVDGIRLFHKIPGSTARVPRQTQPSPSSKFIQFIMPSDFSQSRVILQI